MFGIKILNKIDFHLHLFRKLLISFNMFGIKLFNKKGKKVKIETNFFAYYPNKNAPKTYIFLIATRGTYGLSIDTIKYILNLFFGEYIIFAYNLLYENKLKKINSNNYYIDKIDYNAILLKEEIEYLFFHNVAEQYYFIPFNNKYLNEEVYNIAKSVLNNFEEGKNNKHLLEFKRIAATEDIFDDIAIYYQSLDDFIKDLDKITILMQYFDKNSML